MSSRNCGACSNKVGPSPLKNDSEICYMNSMIQALASSKRLIKDYKPSIFPWKKNKMKTMYKLLQSINKSDNLNDNTEKLKNLIESVQWNRISQQDSFQMLSFFLNSIEKSMGKTALIPPKFQILHTFSENSSYNKVQSHLALAVPLCGQYKVKPGVPLEPLLDAFFAPSFIDDGPHSTSMFIFKKAPSVLILHIQANEWNVIGGKYIKPEYHIIYSDTLNYTFNIMQNKDGKKIKKKNMNYRLVAVVHHMGEVDGGHYITYRKCHNQWYLTNDEQVEEVQFKNDIIPYIMVYELED